MCDYSEQSRASCPDELLELPQTVRDGIRKLHESWNSRLECEHFDARKEYIDGRIGLLIQFDSVTGPRIDAGPPIRSHLEGAIFHFDEGPPIWAYNFDTGNSRHTDNRRQDAMLIGIVQEMQRVQFVASPAFVSCEADEEFLRVAARRFYSVTRGFVVPFAAPMSGKRQKTILCTAINPDQFPCRVIEGGAEVVDSVTNDQGKTFGNWLAKTDLEGDLTVRITADAKRVGVAIYKGGKDGLKITDMMLGPI